VGSSKGVRDPGDRKTRTPALKLSTTPVPLPCGDDTPTTPPCDTGTDAAEQEQRHLPATVAAEHLLPHKAPAASRPGTFTPRRPLGTLPSARKAAHRPSAAMPHAEAVQHAEAREPPETHSHALSAVFTTRSEFDLDLPERPDTLALPQFPELTADMRRPDARTLAEMEAASRLHEKA
jgi:hypothetical protein